MIENFALWLTVWWPWALVWVGTVAALLVAVVVLVKHWRAGTEPLRTDGVGFHLDNDSVMELFENYLEKAEPSAIVDIIMNILEHDDAIVHVDLEKGYVRHNSALETMQADGRIASGKKTVRVGALRSGFVSLTGWYRADEQRDGTYAFTAPFGNSDQVDDGPRVRIECRAAGLRRPVPDGAFRASCLGRIRRWEPDTGELAVDAIALFR